MDMPTAPASTDTQTVVLWVIGCLVVCLLFAVKYILSQQAESTKRNADAEQRCREENARANARADEANRKIESILQDTIGQYGEMNMRNTHAMEQVRDVMRESNELVEKVTRAFQRHIDTDRIERKH